MTDVYDSFGNLIVLGLTAGLAIKTFDMISKELPKAKPNQHKTKSSHSMDWEF